MSDQLTDPGFWDNYWQNVSGWQNVDLRHSYDRAFDAAFRRWLTPDPKQRLLEIGCAPGRWLIYFHRQFGYQVSGCDSAPQAVEVTRANLQQAQVPGEVLLADLMEASLPAAAYDIVMSLGVIEHFADPWPAIEQHVRLIKPGGTLVSGLSSRNHSPRARRQPSLTARAKPRLARQRRSDRSGARRSWAMAGCAGEWLSTTTISARPMRSAREARS